AVTFSRPRSIFRWRFGPAVQRNPQRKNERPMRNASGVFVRHASMSWWHCESWRGNAPDDHPGAGKGVGPLDLCDRHRNSTTAGLAEIRHQSDLRSFAVPAGIVSVNIAHTLVLVLLARFAVATDPMPAAAPLDLLIVAPHPDDETIGCASPS